MDYNFYSKEHIVSKINEYNLVEQVRVRIYVLYVPS